MFNVWRIFLRIRSSPVWLVVLRAECGCVGGSYRGAGLAHQQEEHYFKWNLVPAEAGSFQVCSSSLGNWVGALGRKAEEGILCQMERVEAGDLKDFLAQVWWGSGGRRADEVRQIDSKPLCTWHTGALGLALSLGCPSSAPPTCFLGGQGEPVRFRMGDWDSASQRHMSCFSCSSQGPQSTFWPFSCSAPWI